MFIYIYIKLIYCYEVSVSAWGKTVLQIKRTKLPFHFAKYFSFRLVKFISYFIHRKTNFCQALNRFMRISPVTSCEGSFRGNDSAFLVF